MHLTLIRDTFTPSATTGRLLVDGVFECFVLEDVVRPVGAQKIAGKTAIPYGTYAVIITESARFKRRLPLLVGVPGFAGIRIHPGNTAADTEGCLLPGRARYEGGVAGSRIAFEALFAKLEQALKQGPVEIQITIAGPSAPLAA